MSKKNYLIIGVTALIFIISIILITLSSKTKENWTTDILNANSYQITMTDCNNKEKTLDNSILNTLSNKWNSLSNNGPWTGDISACYTTLTISYETNGIIKQKEILLIDDSSLILDLGTNTIYYTNSNEIIDYLNTLFIG